MLIGYTNIDIDKIKKYSSGNPKWTKEHWADYFCPNRNKIPLSGTDRVMDPTGDRGDGDVLYGLLSHLSEIDQKMEVYMMDDFAAVIGYNGKRFVLPAEFVTVEPLTDYTDVPAERLAAIGSGGMDLPAVRGNTQLSLRAKADDIESQIRLLNEEEKAIKDCTSADMTDLKAQLDALMEQITKRQQDLMAELKKKQDELAAKERELKRELFILETQIYGIRCYLGEVVSFHTVRGGTPAPAALPIVIYQKIRYLDEELGKYISLYGYGDHKNDKEQFLEILKYREDIADIICPGPKSISAVRISRTGTVKGAAENIANILHDYEIYHDNQLAVVIRNGEQIHIAWLDAERISVSDDNLFYRPDVKESEAFDEKDTRATDRMRSESGGLRNEMISRWFFFSVLQGVVDNTSLISLPDKVRITDMNSPYITFSTAEGWLADNSYGSFCDMIEKSKNIPLREGDYVITGMHINRDDHLDKTSWSAWNNNRGIGEKNRTSSASLPGKELLPINKVIPGLHVKYTVSICMVYAEMTPEDHVMYEYDGGKIRTSYPSKDRDDVVIVKEPAYRLVYTDEVVKEEGRIEKISGDTWTSYAIINNSSSYRSLSKKQLARMSAVCEDNVFYIDDTGDERDVYSTFNTEKVAYELQERGIQLYSRKVTDAVVIEETAHQYYCAAQNWGPHGYYNVNFRINTGEMIPMPFLCSTWVKAVITGGNIGEYYLCGDRMSYADMLSYLNTAFTHLREREKKERILIEKAGGGEWLDRTPDWDAVLCEWKIRHRFHRMTERRTKRFLKDAGGYDGFI